MASERNRQLYGEPFARYRRDLTKVNDVMRADGWSKAPDGIWALGDQRATIELTIDAALRFHTLFGQIVSSQWKEAGFDVSLRPVSAAAVISDSLPKGNYQATFGGSAQAGGVSTDPGQCVRFCSRSIPTEATRFTGGNVTRIANPALDDIWARVDTELDPAKRTDLVRRGQELLAEEVPVLPLAAIIDVYVFNIGKIGGPVAVGPALVRLPEWFCRTTCG